MPAGVVQRSLAAFIDVCLFFAIWSAFGATSVDFPLLYALGAAVSVDLALTALFGLTPGRLVMGIRVALPDGRPPGFARALLRTALVFITGVAGPLVLGLRSSSDAAPDRMWWDMASGTSLIRASAADAREATVDGDRIHPRMAGAVAICAVVGIFLGGFLGLVAFTGANPLAGIFAVSAVLVAGAAIVLLIRYQKTACIYVTANEVGRIDASGKVVEVFLRRNIADVHLYVDAMKWATEAGRLRVASVLVVRDQDGADALRLTSWSWSRTDMEKLARLLGQPVAVSDELAPPKVDTFDTTN